MVTRWERERSAWIIQRARTASGRRRGELMARRARRQDREGAGVGDAAMHETVTPWIGRRWVTHEDGGEQAARLVALVIFAGLVLLFLLEAVLVAWAAYALWWALSPWVGRLRGWPLLLAAAVVLAVGWSTGGVQETWRWWAETAPTVTGRPRPIEGVWTSRTWVEVPLGLALAGIHVWRCGWEAVKAAPARQPTAQVSEVHWPTLTKRSSDR